MIVRRPVARFVVAQRRRCASTGTHKNGENTTDNRPEVRFTIDDRGHEVWGSRNAQLPKRIALLRFAHVPESMVDVLSAIREVERNFGRIRDYRLLRVSDYWVYIAGRLNGNRMPIVRQSIRLLSGQHSSLRSL